MLRMLQYVNAAVSVDGCNPAMQMWDPCLDSTENHLYLQGIDLIHTFLLPTGGDPAVTPNQDVHHYHCCSKGWGEGLAKLLEGSYSAKIRHVDI